MYVSGAHACTRAARVGVYRCEGSVLVILPFPPVVAPVAPLQQRAPFPVAPPAHRHLCAGGGGGMSVILLGTVLSSLALTCVFLGTSGVEIGCVTVH